MTAQRGVLKALAPSPSWASQESRHTQKDPCGTRARVSSESQRFEGAEMPPPFPPCERQDNLKELAKSSFCGCRRPLYHQDRTGFHDPCSNHSPRQPRLQLAQTLQTGRGKGAGAFGDGRVDASRWKGGDCGLSREISPTSSASVARGQQEASCSTGW